MTGIVSEEFLELYKFTVEEQFNLDQCHSTNTDVLGQEGCRNEGK
jgi:hypothetical protein